MSNEQGIDNQGIDNKGIDNQGIDNDIIPKKKNTDAPCNSLPCIPKLKNNMWMDLYKYSPPQNLLNDHYFTKFQTLNDFGTGEYNVDYYPIWVKRLPKNMNFKTLLNNIRLHIDKIIPNIKFVPEYKKLYEEKPLGQIVSMVLDKIGMIPIEASVMITKHEDYRWIFTTVFTWFDAHHPISGYREFGIACEKNSESSDKIIIYTRAVDRITKWSAANAISIISPSFKQYMVDCMEQTWKLFQKGVTEYINKNGGAAEQCDFNSQLIDVP